MDPIDDTMSPDHHQVTSHPTLRCRTQLEDLLGQRGCVVWMTGFSGSGKSTLACSLEQRLLHDGRFANVLDGDVLRRGLSNDLGFTAADRHEHIRRVAEVARLFADAGMIAIVALISPYQADRQRARQIAGDRPFLEIHISTPLSVCEQRDPKGLYRKARTGQVIGFTGVDDPYEEPLSPDMRLDTQNRTVSTCVDDLLVMMHDHNLLRHPQPIDGHRIGDGGASVPCPTASHRKDVSPGAT